MFSKDTLEFNTILSKVSRYTYTDSSKEIMLKTEPSTSHSEVTKNLAFTFELSGLIKRFGKLPFIEHYDIKDLIYHLEKGIGLSISDVLTIRLFISMEHSIIGYTKNFDLNAYQHLHAVIHALFNHGDVLKLIDSIMNIDGEIYDHASPELSSIRKNMHIKSSALKNQTDRLLAKYQTYLNENLIAMRNNRYVIPVKEAYKHKIKGVIHDVSTSGQTVYIEPDDIRILSQELELLTALEQQEIIKILDNLSKNISSYHDSLSTNLALFITLDVYHAKAMYGNEISGIMPQITETFKLSLNKARHPLIDKDVCVPIDVLFNEDTKLIIISGPNTGGKTVALKTLGLLVLMNQSGLLIPASESSKLPIFKGVFADIGDEQSIEQSLSTFSSHLTKIKKMIDNLHDKQLILLDEIGSGTDPQEGVALAFAILNRLREKNIKAMITTHYSELKLYALQYPGILNASVAFDKDTLKPLYELRLGISGASQALTIASRIGLDAEIIHDAKNHLGLKQSDLSKMIDTFNDEKLKVLSEHELLQEKLIEVDQKITQLEDEKRQFDLTKDEIIEKIKQKETVKWQKLKSELTDLISELEKKSSLSLPEVSKAKGVINQSISSDGYQSESQEIVVGDLVYIKSYQQEGIVKKIVKDTYEVSFGPFLLSFKKDDLRRLEKPKQVAHKSIKPKVKLSGTNPERTASMELDLRGKRYEEVKELMDHAIDRAILANYQTLRIIHGFGTGVIRKAVHDYIKTSPQIKAHRYGGEGEGLNGVTIITLS